MRKTVWVEGHIAVFAGDSRYLIERVRDCGHGHVDVDFRSLREWQLCSDDRRMRFDLSEEGCEAVREPTDRELAWIARCRLLGGVDA